MRYSTLIVMFALLSQGCFFRQTIYDNKPFSNSIQVVRVSEPAVIFLEDGRIYNVKGVKIVDPVKANKSYLVEIDDPKSTSTKVRLFHETKLVCGNRTFLPFRHPRYTIDDLGAFWVRSGIAILLEDELRDDPEYKKELIRNSKDVRASMK